MTGAKKEWQRDVELVQTSPRLYANERLAARRLGYLLDLLDAEEPEIVDRVWRDADRQCWADRRRRRKRKTRAQ